MPAQSTWFHRLNEILSELRSLQTLYLDRQAVEQIFGVRERRARQLMAGLPCLQIGNAVGVSRQALVERVENIAVGQHCQWELRRRARVSEAVDTMRRQAAARRVVVPALTDVHDRTLSDLPSGVELRRGELCIQFGSAEDLAAKLFELSQAMANDWQAFVTAVDA
jgi:hypothetical protein